VLGVDTGFHRAGWLYNDATDTVETGTRTSASLVCADLDGVDAVVHMAELSNDPVGQLRRTLPGD